MRIIMIMHFIGTQCPERDMRSRYIRFFFGDIHTIECKLQFQAGDKTRLMSIGIPQVSTVITRSYKLVVHVSRPITQIGAGLLEVFSLNRDDAR